MGIQQNNLDAEKALSQGIKMNNADMAQAAIHGYGQIGLVDSSRPTPEEVLRMIREKEAEHRKYEARMHEAERRAIRERNINAVWQGFIRLVIFVPIGFAVVELGLLFGRINQ